MKSAHVKRGQCRYYPNANVSSFHGVLLDEVTSSLAPRRVSVEHILYYDYESKIALIERPFFSKEIL